MKRQKVLRRARVNRALESIFDYPLTVVEAPMGYGKTTALRDFIMDKGCPFMWLTFLSPEDTHIYFWDMLSAEICRFDNETGASLKSLGFPADASQTAHIISLMRSLELPQDTILIIDDYHLVKDKRIGKLLSHFVAAGLDELHITVLTRDISNLEIDELLVKGQCCLLEQRIFEFTEEEVADYCALMGFSCSSDVLLKVRQYTGGWISMIYLIMLGVQKGIPVGLSHAIGSLVEKILYNAYDEQIKQFLMRLSVMDSFTEEQALFVTEEERCGEFLRKLRRENAFVMFDEAAETYKIHHVLLDFLRSKFNGNPQQTAYIHRLGEWHLTRNEKKKAYKYFFKAGDVEQVLALLDSEDVISLDPNEFEEMLELFPAQPQEVLIKYPIAYMQYIAFTVLSGDRTLMDEGLMLLDRLQEVYESEDGIPASRRDRILGGISTIRVFSVWNDQKKMMAYVREAIDHLAGYVGKIIKQDAEFTFGSPHLIYSYYRRQDDLKELADRMAADFPDLQLLTGESSSGSDYLIMAEYALETGDWNKVEINAYKAAYKNQTSIMLCAEFALIRLYIYQGKTSEAMEHLFRLREIVTAENKAIHNTTLEIIEGYVHACLGREEGIPGWLRTGDMSPVRFVYQGHAFNYIVYGKATLLRKNYILLELIAAEFSRYLSEVNYKLAFLHSKIFEAIAKCRLYGFDAGCAVLKEALDEAKGDHIILIFAEYAPDILDMVRHLSITYTSDQYIKEVYRACGQYMKALRQAEGSAGLLSSRETEVLALMAEGLKRPEIAKRLDIMPGTVKIHIEHIYYKLDAKNKLDAVNKARNLKII
ncbi:MAG: LuxR family transcriptional regulator [Clostridiaceae bacterium]|nr:LuxR family transcriptional regulator [Clostridiaceae bacterium]